jgi:hypothetical protein
MDIGGKMMFEVAALTLAALFASFRGYKLS